MGSETCCAGATPRLASRTAARAGHSAFPPRRRRVNASVPDLLERCRSALTSSPAASSWPHWPVSRIVPFVPSAAAWGPASRTPRWYRPTVWSRERCKRPATWTASRTRSRSRSRSSPPSRRSWPAARRWRSPPGRGSSTSTWPARSGRCAAAGPGGAGARSRPGRGRRPGRGPGGAVPVSIKIRCRLGRGEVNCVDVGARRGGRGRRRVAIHGRTRNQMLRGAGPLGPHRGSEAVGPDPGPRTPATSGRRGTRCA